MIVPFSLSSGKEQLPLVADAIICAYSVIVTNDVLSQKGGLHCDAFPNFNSVGSPQPGCGWLTWQLSSLWSPVLVSQMDAPGNVSARLQNPTHS